jgi:hypothetical protein
VSSSAENAYLLQSIKTGPEQRYLVSIISYHFLINCWLIDIVRIQQDLYQLYC